ncbi:hypothetical protein [Xylanibacter brevis]|uniref:hypothetical protein n=1 Tax=Xylanibacter brevis TaxID=83231 RepID=UPI000B18AEBD|nr:hypothetical protein [Xylanibacter brevis]
MKKVLFAFATLLTMAACNNKTATSVENKESSEIPFTVAKNYFYNHLGTPSVKITTEEDFNKCFHMATTMGEEGKPTAIDFGKQFVVDFLLPGSQWQMEINPLKVETKGDTLFYSYDIKVGQKQSYWSQYVSIIIIDKEFEKQEVVLVNDQDITYEQAIKRYLVNEIGKDYAQAEFCVPFYSKVDIDDSNPEDIKYWGEFWIHNYNQVGDTLKCVSGGNHPGLMHIRKTEMGFEVIAFDQVADGADNLPSAKKIFGDKYEAFHKMSSDDDWRKQMIIDQLGDFATEHNLTATMYQDYAWPAIYFKIPLE